MYYILRIQLLISYKHIKHVVVLIFTYKLHALDQFIRVLASFNTYAFATVLHEVTNRTSLNSRINSYI